MLADGLAFDPSAGILYAALNNVAGGFRVRGFDIITKAVVFDSGPVAGVPDGIALGKGPAAGDLFINTNGGTLIEVKLASQAQTVIATGGSRGDFVTVDPSNATLLVTQSDRIMRLTPGFFVIPPHLVTTTTTLSIAPAVSNSGQTVTVTAIVATAGTGLPAGAVTFTIDGQCRHPSSWLTWEARIERASRLRRWLRGSTPFKTDRVPVSVLGHVLEISPSSLRPDRLGTSIRRMTDTSFLTVSTRLQHGTLDDRGRGLMLGASPQWAVESVSYGGHRS